MTDDTPRPERPAASRSPSAELLERLAADRPRGSRYELLGEVARGGMGAILKVWDADLRRTLAMKVVLGKAERAGDTPSADARTLGRFLEEAQVTGQLDHPGVVPVHELGVDSSGSVYFTMRLVKGRDLREVFELVEREEGGWNRTRALGVVLKICEAMAYAHSKGVIHRDLKPGNVMVGRFGEVYVMDWGLAKVLGREDGRDLRLRPADSTTFLHTERAREREVNPETPLVTMDGAVVGTPAYMPPEQARGEVDRLDARSDVYSLGAILYHLLAGCAPYAHAGRSASPHVVLRLLLHGPPAPLHQVRPGVPAELEAICQKAMAREPGARYAGTLEMAEDLRAYLENRVVRAYETGAAAELRKWVVRNRALAATLAGAALVVTLGSTGASVVLAGKNRELGAAHDAARERARELQLQSYENAIAAADGALAAGDVTTARQYLERTEPERRSWEWRWLAARADSSESTLHGHAGAVRCVATDASGTLLASYGDDEYVRLWDAAAWRELRRVRVPDPGWPHVVEFDRALTFGAAPVEEPDGSWSVGMWDLATGERARTLRGLAERAGGLAFSPDGRRLAAAADALVVWDASSGAELLRAAHEGGASALAFSPDGAWIGILDRGGELSVVDSGTGEPRVPPLVDPPSLGRALAFTRDGSLVASSSTHDTIQVWDAASGRPRQRFVGHADRVTTLAFHPDGRHLVSGSRDGSVRVWDLESEDDVKLLLGHRGTSYAAFTPGGERIVSASHDGTLKTWSGVAPPPVIPPQAQTGDFRMFGTPDGRRIAVRGMDGRVAFWDLERREKLAELELDHELYRWGAVSPDGERFAATVEGGAIGIWEFETGALVGRLEGHAGPVFHLAYHPSGERLASASVDGTARLWDLASGECTAVLHGHVGPVRCVAFDAPGRRLVTGGDDECVRIWDAGTARLLRTLERAGNSVWDARLVAGGERLAVLTWPGHPEYTVELWDLTARPAARRRVGVFQGWGRAGLVVTHDGMRFAVSKLFEPRLALFDARRGTRLLALRADLGVNHGLVGFVGPSGDRLLAYGARGNLVTFDASRGRELERVLELRSVAREEVERLFAELLFREAVLERLYADTRLAEDLRRSAIERVAEDPRTRRLVVNELEHRLVEAGRGPAAYAADLATARRLREILPEDHDAERLVGYALVRTGELARGCALLERARAWDGGEHPTAVGFLALAHLARGDAHAARLAIERVRRLLAGGWNSLYVGGHEVLRQAEELMSTL